MTFNFFSRACVTSMAAVAFLSACGAGDNLSAGSITPFSTVPTKITLTGQDTATCGFGIATQVFIFGGAAPYVISNTQPDVLVVDPPTVASPGGSFTVIVLPNGCMADVPVAITDQTGKLITFTVTTVKGT